METISFYYKNSSGLIAFTPILELLFENLFLRSVVIKYVRGSSSQEAGEAVLTDFQKSPSPILIVEGNIAIPENITHVIFNKGDGFADFLEKMRVAGIK